MRASSIPVIVPVFCCPICRVEVRPPDVPHATLDDCTKAQGEAEARFQQLVKCILETKVSQLLAHGQGDRPILPDLSPRMPS